MESAKRNLAKKINTWRDQNGVKMETAALELGVSTATWGHWETGRRFPSLKHLWRLSKYLKIPICRLICHYPDNCADCAENNVSTQSIK